MNVKNDMPDFLEDLSLPPEANLQLADPQLVSYYKNYKDRIIYLDKDVDATLYDEIRLILQWNREDNQNNIPPEKRKVIKILIHSYGGDLDTCMALVDVIEKSKTPISTINMGVSMSCGGLILMAGHKGLRYAMPMSTALIHSGSGSTGMTSFDQAQAQNENWKHMIATIRDFIMSHTKIDKTQMNKWKNKEVYLYLEDQLKWGLIDKEVTDITEII